MRLTNAKVVFCALALVTPLATQASNYEHSGSHSNNRENHSSQDDSQRRDGVIRAVSVPEPASIALVGAGLIGLIATRRKTITTKNDEKKS